MPDDHSHAGQHAASPPDCPHSVVSAAPGAHSPSVGDDAIIPPAPDGLFLSGIAPHEGGSVLLLSPDPQRFWPLLAAAEGADGAPDPVDRWSRRVITAYAAQLRGSPVFPFDGPPFAPFMAWALASGRAFASPVGMLVHDRMGLWASYRGAVLLDRAVPMPPPAARPCDLCAQPCRSACPVDALHGARYDTDACHAWLDGPEGGDCLTFGCGARRACPLAAAHGRLPAQAAHHMRYFHP